MSGALRGSGLRRPWGRLQVWRGGAGPPLLAIHGLGGSGRYWAGLLRLVGDRFSVVAPDLAGFGLSDKPALSYDRTFHLDNLDAVADAAAGGSQVTLVGHSLGGVLAGLWAARHPERIAAIALVTTPFPSSDHGMPAGEEQTWGKDQRPSRRRVYSALQAAWPTLTFPIRSRVFPRAVIVDYMRHTLPSYWGTARAVLWDSATEAELAPLARLRGVPALILNASDDRVVDAGDGQRWADLLPGAQRLMTTGGHQLLLRNHFALVAQWLRTQPPG